MLAVDNGTDALNLPATDLAGNPRKIISKATTNNMGVDAGAFEFQIAFIPTLSQWALFILGLIITAISLVYIKSFVIAGEV